MEQQRREALIAALQDADPRVRDAAALSLGQLDQRRHSSQLLEQLADGTREQKVLALFGLEGVDSDDIKTALCAALKDSDPDVRAAAVQVVGKKRYPSALNDLVNCLQDGHAAVVVYAVQALAGYRDARLVPYLETIYQRGDEEIKCACLTGLGSMGFAAAEGTLLRALASENAAIRAAAATALGLLSE